MNVAVHLGLLLSLAGAVEGGDEPAKGVPAESAETITATTDESPSAPIPTASARAEHATYCECSEPSKKSLLPRFLRTKKCDCAEPAQTGVPCSCNEACDRGSKKPALFERLLGKSRAKKPCEMCSQPTCVPVAMHETDEPHVVHAHTDDDALAALEEPTRVVPIEVNVPTPQPSTASVTDDIQPRHAEDYRWIQGRLHWVHVNGGAWVVRYMPLDEVDSYGGSVVLARSDRLKDHREGDFVRIEGEILSDRSSVFLGGPLYRVERVTLLQSSDGPQRR
ncbi:MAG: hypothetical protein U1D30_14310 [Planctomycetota bacterium]